MKQRLLWLAPLAAIGLVALVLLFGTGRETAPPQRVSCADLQAGCALRLDGRPATVGFAGQPRVLAPFEVWVRLEGARVVQARFDMADMDMGFNLYTLRPDADGVFRARVTLPVCVSGRRDWVMTLDIDGHRVEVPFVTEMS